MSVNILDTDAIDKMAAIEGSHWKNYQKQNEHYCGFPYSKTKYYKEKQSALEYWDSLPINEKEDDYGQDVNYYLSRSLDLGLCIYGDGGLNRYFVNHLGNILFSARHCCFDRQLKQAESIGFDILR